MKNPWKFKTRRVSTNLSKPLESEAVTASSGGFDISETEEAALTLACLPLGARLILRCRKDWRVAVIALILPDKIVLSVSSPSGHTYRVRRPPETPLSCESESSIPILGAGCWRAGLVRYDVRW